MVCPVTDQRPRFALTGSTPSDFPMHMGSHAFFGPRTWYEIDYDASDGIEVIYRYIGTGKDFPQRPLTEGDHSA